MHAFTVLADPVRRRIVEVLAGGERSAGAVVADVGGEFGISQSAVSQHLRVLRDHGFARVRPVGARRVYALEPTAVEAVDRWLAGVRGFWADRLDDLAAEVEARPPAPVEEAGTTPLGAAVGTLGHIARIDRTVRDIAESEAFYGTALGLQRLAVSTMTAAFAVGDTRLLLVQHDAPAADESVLAFAVHDLSAAMHRLRAAGVALRGPRRAPHDHADRPGAWTASFADPEGRPLALVARHDVTATH